MKLVHTVCLVLAIVVGAPVWAQQADPHAAHQAAMAAGQAGDPASAATATSKPAEPDPAIARMDAQVKAMADIHAKMTAARTPAERKALMPAQLKLMQDGMDMMNAMHAGMQSGMQPGMQCPMAGGMAGHQQMMQTHVALMQAMMQAMMDRMSAGG